MPAPLPMKYSPHIGLVIRLTPNAMWQSQLKVGLSAIETKLSACSICLPYNSHAWSGAPTGSISTLKHS